MVMVGWGCGGGVGGCGGGGGRGLQNGIGASQILHLQKGKEVEKVLVFLKDFETLKF